MQQERQCFLLFAALLQMKPVGKMATTSFASSKLTIVSSRIFFMHLTASINARSLEEAIQSCSLLVPLQLIACDSTSSIVSPQSDDNRYKPPDSRLTSGNFSQWEFSVSGETENSVAPKMSTDVLFFFLHSALVVALRTYAPVSYEKK